MSESHPQQSRPQKPQKPQSPKQHPQPKSHASTFARYLVGGIIIAALVVVVLYFFFRPTKTTTNDASYTPDQPATSLYCYNRSSLESGLFNDQDAIIPLHEIEAILYGDKLHDVTYTFTGEYADHAAAATAEAYIHAAVNTKISALNLSDSSINQTYSVPDNKLIARITLTDTMLTADTVPMVLFPEGATALPSGLTAVKNIYTSQGFICESNKE